MSQVEISGLMPRCGPDPLPNPLPEGIGGDRSDAIVRHRPNFSWRRLEGRRMDNETLIPHFDSFRGSASVIFLPNR